MTYSEIKRIASRIDVQDILTRYPNNKLIVPRSSPSKTVFVRAHWRKKPKQNKS